jgi:Tol biopolymer transport system component
MRRSQLAFTALVIAAVAAPAAEAKITNGCVSSTEQAAKGSCHRPSFSADSRFLAFDSNAANLVSNDKNGGYDVFVRDLLRGKTELISNPLKGGGTPDAVSFQAQISADGRYVAFVSVAQNLVRAKKPSKDKAREVYLYDRQTHKTQLVSATPDGDAGNKDSDQVAISGDGSVVVFRSEATDLVSDDTNRADDIFAWSAHTGEVTRVNVTQAGEQDRRRWGSEGPTISDDGNLVAFAGGGGTTLAPSKYGEIFVKHLDTGELENVSVGLDGKPGNGSDDEAAISGNGQFVAFSSTSTNVAPGTPPDAIDRFMYRRDLSTQTTEQVNADGDDQIAFHPTISADGSKIAYMLKDLPFTEIYTWDAADGQHTLQTPDTKHRGDTCPHSLSFDCGEVSTPTLSPDGTVLAFEGIGTSYIPDDGKHVDLLVSDLAP